MATVDDFYTYIGNKKNDQTLFNEKQKNTKYFIRTFHISGTVAVDSVNIFLIQINALTIYFN
jgi:hypothetical protein